MEKSVLNKYLIKAAFETLDFGQTDIGISCYKSIFTSYFGTIDF